MDKLDELSCRYPTCACSEFNNCEAKRQLAKAKLKNLRYIIPGIESKSLRIGVLVHVFGLPVSFFLASLVVYLYWIWTH